MTAWWYVELLIPLYDSIIPSAAVSHDAMAGLLLADQPYRIFSVAYMSSLTDGDVTLRATIDVHLSHGIQQSSLTVNEAYAH